MEKPHFESERIAELEAEVAELRKIRQAAIDLRKVDGQKCLACSCALKDHTTRLEVALGHALYEFDRWEKKKGFQLLSGPPPDLY